MAKHEFYEIYSTLKIEKRIDYLLENYGQIEALLVARKESLIYSMSNQRAYNRKKNSDELGIRVQTSGVFKSRTEEEAIEHYMLSECVNKGEISEEMENGIENVKEINQAIFDLHVLKNEYYIVVRHVESLPLKLNNPG